MKERKLPWRANPVAGELVGWMVLFFPVSLLIGALAWLLKHEIREERQQGRSRRQH
jgi:hypothetical protein